MTCPFDVECVDLFVSCHDVLLRFYFDMFITNIIVQVLTKGRQFLTSDVSPDESKDIRLQMKVLIVF